jgi:hypothetical protein
MENHKFIIEIPNCLLNYENSPTNKEICANVLRKTSLSQIVDSITRKSSLKTMTSPSSYENLSTKADDFEFEENFTADEISIIIDNFISQILDQSELPEKIKKYLDDINKLPKIPRKPSDSECCGSGCCPCIWDVYNRDLEKHQRAVDELSEKICDYEGI